MQGQLLPPLQQAQEIDLQPQARPRDMPLGLLGLLLRAAALPAAQAQAGYGAERHLCLHLAAESSEEVPGVVALPEPALYQLARLVRMPRW